MAEDADRETRVKKENPEESDSDESSEDNVTVHLKSTPIPPPTAVFVRAADLRKESKKRKAADKSSGKASHKCSLLLYTLSPVSQPLRRDLFCGRPSDAQNARTNL